MTHCARSVEVGFGHSWYLRSFTASSKASPTIVGLHGFSGTGADFGLLQHLMPAKWCCPDILGHGESDAPKDPAAYTMSFVASQLARLLADELSGPYVLMGYSMGARLALSAVLGELAAGVPRPRPERLILIGGRPGLRGAEARLARQRADTELADRIEAQGTEWFAEYWSKRPILESQQQIAALEHQRIQAARREQRPHGLAGSLRGMGAGAMPSLWKQLPRLDVPTTLVTGRLDTKFSEIAREMAGIVPRAQHLLIAEAGHTAHLERPERFVEVLRFALDA